MARLAVDTKVRRMAGRLGLTVVKSRNRAVVRQRGGFMVLNADGQIVAGGAPAAYSLRLDELQQFLKGEQG